jgi:prepilin-type processing-associated H-X9-DG protein
VADLVNQGTDVGAMLCPANPHKLSETYHELLTATASTLSGGGVDPAGSKPTRAPDGSELKNPCRKLLELPPGSPQRVQIIVEEILDKGYNTNYTASWYLVRTEPALDASGNLKSTPQCPANLKSRVSARGPLSQTNSDVGGIPITRIPLLACGGASDESQSVRIGDFPAGLAYAASFTAGPVNRSTMKMITLPANTPRSGANGWWQKWNKEALHDFRDFAPVHGGGSQRGCNILFADGSVRMFVDENGDGLLNSGFIGTRENGFADNVVELPEKEVATKWTLKRQN